MSVELLQTDELIEQASRMQQEAVEIYNDSKSDAQDIERAERLMDGAGKLLERSEQMDRIRKEFEQRVNGSSAEQTQNQNDPETKDQETEPDGFRSLGEMFQAIKRLTKDGIADHRLRRSTLKDISPRPGQLKDMTGLVGEGGGFLVQPEHLAGIRAHIESETIVRPRAVVLPMNSRTLSITALQQSSVPSVGEPNWFGQFRAYWEGESDSITDSDPKFRQIELVAHDLTAITYIPDSLIEDSAEAITALVTGPLGFGALFAWKEDFAFLQGSGSGQPLGVVDAPCTVSQARATSGTIKYDDVTAILNSSLPTSQGIWVAAIDTRATLMKMEGPSGNPSYVWQPSARDDMPDQLLGRPIIFTDKLPALGSAADIMYCDFSHYYIGDRRQIVFGTSTEYRFPQNQTAFKGVARLDGMPWLDAPFTLQDGSRTISPFVKLAA